MLVQRFGNNDFGESTNMLQEILQKTSYMRIFCSDTLPSSQLASQSQANKMNANVHKHQRMAQKDKQQIWMKKEVLQVATIIIIWRSGYIMLLLYIFLVQRRDQPFRSPQDLVNWHQEEEHAPLKEMENNAQMTWNPSQWFLTLTAPNELDSNDGKQKSEHITELQRCLQQLGQTVLHVDSYFDQQRNGSVPKSQHKLWMPSQSELQSKNCIADDQKQMSNRTVYNITSIYKELCLKGLLVIMKIYDTSAITYWKNNDMTPVIAPAVQMRHCLLDAMRDTQDGPQRKSIQLEIENDVIQQNPLSRKMAPCYELQPVLRGFESDRDETQTMVQLSNDFTEEEHIKQTVSESPCVHLRLMLKQGRVLQSDDDRKTADDQDILRRLVSVLFSELRLRGCHDSADNTCSSDYLTVYPVSTPPLKRAIGALEWLAVVPAYEPGSATHSIELFRLISFEKWPHIGTMSTLKFSIAGFHYAGPSDTVTCHSCGLSLKGWTALAQPLEIHLQRCDGRCQLIGDPALSSNLPLTASHVNYLTAPRSITSNDVLTPDSAGYYLRERGSVFMFIKDPTKLHKNLNREVFNDELRQQQQQQQQQREELWKFESYRLMSFNGMWHYGHIVKPLELARSGFYYTGPADRVQCAFCQGALRHWEEGDKPDELHAKHFNYCRFVQGHDVGNVPIPFGSQAEATCTATGDTFKAPGTIPSEGLGIFSSVPKHADFAVESRRLSTFATWSASHHLRAEILAQAGFFFTGTDDAATCFFCDGTVSGWKADSDPWKEHARRFPTCPYLLQVKGRGFVDQNRTTPASASGSGAQRTSFAVDPREIRARMDTPAVRLILKMDYPSDLVREVIQRRLSTTGSDHGNSEELLADLFNFHDEKQRSSNTTLDRKAAPVMPVVVSEPNATEHGGSSYSGGTLVAIAASAPASGETHFASNTAEDRATISVAPQRQPPQDENRQLKTQLICKICMDAVVGIIFLPCGHLVSCAACAPALTSCPICRVSIRGTARVTF